MMETIYREVLLDHYRRPRNKGAMPDPSVSIAMRNPVCGDDVRVELRIANGTIEDVRFTGQGCSISQASASMMTERVAGLSVDEALGVERRFLDLMRGDAGAAEDRALGDLRSLSGVAKLPVRIKCALLAWDALDQAIVAHRGGGRGVLGEYTEVVALPEGFDPAAARDELP